MGIIMYWNYIDEGVEGNYNVEIKGGRSRSGNYNVVMKEKGNYIDEGNIMWNYIVEIKGGWRGNYNVLELY